jgi:hypothetical protein
LLDAVWQHHLIVVLGRLKILSPVKETDELIWFMNQYGEVLRTDPELLPTILELDQWNRVRATFAYKALLCFLVFHKYLQMFKLAHDRLGRTLALRVNEFKY